jgi:hypothetical protein
LVIYDINMKVDANIYLVILAVMICDIFAVLCSKRHHATFGSARCQQSSKKETGPRAGRV